MKAVLNKLKRKVRMFKAGFKTPLPKGVAEFHAWADDIIDLAGAPNNDSVKFMLASAIPHTGPQDGVKAKKFFVLTLQKAMANQVAYGVIQELKAQQEARQKAEVEAASRAEAINVESEVHTDKPV